MFAFFPLGESIEAQTHDNLTMLFSDLVGFTAICATATPMDVISLLQSLYTQFDAFCDHLDVYKVMQIIFHSTLAGSSIVISWSFEPCNVINYKA